MWFFVAMAITLFVQWDGFFFTDVKPRQDMQPLGSIQFKAYEAQNGQMVERCYDARIAQYVIWLKPPREPMYLIYANGTAITVMIEIDRLPEVLCSS